MNKRKDLSGKVGKGKELKQKTYSGSCKNAVNSSLITPDVSAPVGHEAETLVPGCLVSPAPHRPPFPCHGDGSAAGNIDSQKDCSFPTAPQ
ncbi:unnamed protein product, partial [Bubo scandiacus]